MCAGTPQGPVVDRGQGGCQRAQEESGQIPNKHAMPVGAAPARRSTCADTCPGPLDDNRQRRPIIIFTPAQARSGLLVVGEQARLGVRAGTHLQRVVSMPQLREVLHQLALHRWAQSVKGRPRLHARRKASPCMCADTRPGMLVHGREHR